MPATGSMSCPPMQGQEWMKDERHSSFILINSLVRLAYYNPRYSKDSASILADCPPVN